MAVAGASSAIGFQVPIVCPSVCACSRVKLNTRKKKTTPRKAAFGVAHTPSQSLSSTRSLAVFALKSQEDDQLNLNTDNPDSASTSKEDLNYLLKLGSGSILGAAAIKYGSILLPEITKPNIVQALAMISAPVIVAALLLINKSRNQ